MLLQGSESPRLSARQHGPRAPAAPAAAASEPHTAFVAAGPVAAAMGASLVEGATDAEGAEAATRAYHTVAKVVRKLVRSCLLPSRGRGWQEQKGRLGRRAGSGEQVGKQASLTLLLESAVQQVSAFSALGWLPLHGIALPSCRCLASRAAALQA